MNVDQALGTLLTSSAFRDLHAHLADRDNVLSVFRIEAAELQHTALLSWLLRRRE